MNKRQNIKKRSFFASKNKLFKAMGGTALAVLISVGAILGLMPLSTNISAAHQNAATSGPQGAQNAADTADGGLNNTTSNTFNLSPETDPTLFTTQSGLEIKQHNIVASGSYTNLQYFTLGSYNGSPLNWLILAFNPSSFLTDSSPAGNAINNDGSKQVMMSQTTTYLGVNQLLCLSQYAFELGTYNPNFTANTQISYSFSSSNYSGFQATTNEWTDYVTYTVPTILENSLSLGTTLGLNGYYGNGSGKIVVNNTFSSNYVFSLNSSHYTTFVGSTGYKIPYLFTATSTATAIFSSDTVMSGTVTSTFGSYDSSSSGYGNLRKVSGSGAAYSYLINTIGTSGSVENSATLGNFTASGASLSTYYTYSGGRNYGYTTTYKISSQSSITLAYRPAFVLNI